jgi:hypothetical protein
MHTKIICGECGEALTLGNAKAMRQHALGTYSFLCGFCYEEEA